MLSYQHIWQGLRPHELRILCLTLVWVLRGLLLELELGKLLLHFISLSILFLFNKIRRLFRMYSNHIWLILLLLRLNNSIIWYLLFIPLLLLHGLVPFELKWLCWESRIYSLQVLLRVNLINHDILWVSSHELHALLLHLLRLLLLSSLMLLIVWTSLICRISIMYLLMHQWLEV